MEPTFYTNDKILARNFTHLAYKPERFDIVILNKPGGNYPIIKRVIGLPGENVRLKDGRTYINDRLIKETYVRFSSGVCDDCSFQVPEGKIFVLGDNRCNSIDSRCFGVVSIVNVKAQAILVYWKNLKILTPYYLYGISPLWGFFY